MNGRAQTTGVFLLLPAAVLISLVLGGTAVAYNPPVDSAGPITVRIEGPEEVTRVDTPLPVCVVVENKDDKPIEGTLELKLIDRWRWEPQGQVSFKVGGNSKSTHEFRVTAGKGTFSAHYPIHVFARFQFDGKRHTAHPILVIETKLPPLPRPAVSIHWKPIPVPADGQLALWRVPVRRAVVQVFGEKPQTMPVGWQGTEPRSKASLGVRSETLGGKTRETVAMHPPWWEGHVGTMLVEYPLVLPEKGPIKLRFGHAVTPTGEGDGITFRVRVLPFDAPDGEFGKVVFEQHSAAKSWQAAEVDLSLFAGRSVRLQLESHPGPKKNTGWDQSYWAEPLLTTGTLPPAPEFPPKSTTGSQLLGILQRGDKRYEVRFWPGRRGLLDAVVGFVQGDKRLFFHGFEVKVLGGRIDDARSPICLTKVETESLDGGCQVKHSFSDPSGKTFQVIGRILIEDNVLRAKFRLQTDQPPVPWHPLYLEDVAAGPWSCKATHVYAGAGNVIRDPKDFRLSFDGHRLSTSFVGFDFDDGISMVQAVDVPPDDLRVHPSRKHYSLHVPHESTMTFIPAENVWDAVHVYRKANGLKPAGGVPKLAGRFVFDLWHGRYADSRKALEKAFRYGLTDSVVVWHNWQRWGYDYRLPEIYPPNPKLGTERELRGMIETCKKHGVLFAPHDNYIDYYPDAEKFSYEKQIAFSRDGRPVKAWWNEWRGARSYRYRADRIEPLLQGNLKLIREHLRPDAYFIDVFSSIKPYDYWTADGKFVSRVVTRDVWGQQFAWIREFLGNKAPQISESGHDQLIGWLDGAQANHFRVGEPGDGDDRHRWCTWNWKCSDAERTPWFDAAHHDRFIMHGAGYPGRYQAGLDGRAHGVYSDDYIATEVLTGHPAMVSGPFGRDVVRKYWLLHNLMRALALRQIERVEYVGNDLHRQHVVWSGGGNVWVNRGRTDWQISGHTLPQYGFLARTATKQGMIEAAIARRNGHVVEWARSPQHVYVNGRQAADNGVSFGEVTTTGGCRITREGKSLLVMPLPGEHGPRFVVRIDPARLPWKLPKPTHVEAIDEHGKVLKRQAVQDDAGAIELTSEPGVFAYRLTAD